MISSALKKESAKNFGIPSCCRIQSLFEKVSAKYFEMKWCFEMQSWTCCMIERL